MSMLLIALATATVSPAQSGDLRCVARLALVAAEQKRGTGWGDYPPVADEGADYAAAVGEDVMTTTGKTREQVRDLILANVADVQKGGRSNRTEIDKCTILMHVRMSKPPAKGTPN